MDWFPDPMKPLSEKSAAELATEAWLYDEMTGGDDEHGSGGGPSKPPSVPPSGGGSSFGCFWGVMVGVLVILILLLFAWLMDSCISSVRHHTESTYSYSYTTTTTTTSSTTFTTSYRYTTSYRFTTRAGTTRDDPYDAHGYIDADDFAAENWEEFDDYDEAYDYYEDDMAGYE